MKTRTLQELDEISTTQIKGVCSIDDTDINAEFVRVPADLSYWNSIFSDSLKIYSEAKRKMDSTFDELYLEFKAGEKVTEQHVKSKVGSDPRYLNSCAYFEDAEAVKVRIYGIVDAIRTKKDCLISLASNIRAEHKSLFINER